MRQSFIFYNSGRTFTSWVVFSHHQWIIVGASGRHGNHAAWLAEEETEHVLAHALIQHQKGTERIALGQIPQLRAAICTNVQVDIVIWNFHFPSYIWQISVYSFDGVALITWYGKRRNRRLVLHGMKFLFYCHVMISFEFNMENIHLNTSE